MCEGIVINEVQQRKDFSNNLIFVKPHFFKKGVVIDDFRLNKVFTNIRTSIYENEDVRFCFDKKIIRVYIYDCDNLDLKQKIQDYFYEKKWKRKDKFIIVNL